MIGLAINNQGIHNFLFSSEIADQSRRLLPFLIALLKFFKRAPKKGYLFLDLFEIELNSFISFSPKTNGK